MTEPDHLRNVAIHLGHMATQGEAALRRHLERTHGALPGDLEYEGIVRAHESLHDVGMTHTIFPDPTLPRYYGEALMLAGGDISELLDHLQVHGITAESKWVNRITLHKIHLVFHSSSTPGNQ